MTIDRLRELATLAWSRARRIPPVFVLVSVGLTLPQLAALSLGYMVAADLTYDDYMDHGYQLTVWDAVFFSTVGVVMLVTAAGVVGIYLGQRWGRIAGVAFHALFTSGCVAMWQIYDISKFLIPAAACVIAVSALLVPKRSRGWFTPTV